MPYIWTNTNNELRLGRAFTKDGMQYPPNWLTHASAAEVESIGIEWVEDDRPRVNEKYYRVHGTRGDWTVTPKDLDELKSKAVAVCKRHANSRLSQTDWYVVRKAEGGADIPADVTEFRAATRAYSNTLEAEIEAADFESIQKIKQEWPITEEEEEHRNPPPALQ